MLLEAYDITGQVVFITGVGRGIGKGIAQVLAVAGVDIVLNAFTARMVFIRSGRRAQFSEPQVSF